MTAIRIIPNLDILRIRNLKKKIFRCRSSISNIIFLLSSTIFANEYKFPICINIWRLLPPRSALLQRLPLPLVILLLTRLSLLLLFLHFFSSSPSSSFPSILFFIFFSVIFFFCRCCLPLAAPLPVHLLLLTHTSAAVIGCRPTPLPDADSFYCHRCWRCRCSYSCCVAVGHYIFCASSASNVSDTNMCEEANKISKFLRIFWFRSAEAHERPGCKAAKKSTLQRFIERIYIYIWSTEL